MKEVTMVLKMLRVQTTSCKKTIMTSLLTMTSNFIKAKRR